MSEKTEQPTEKKKRDSRLRGQTIKSLEITSGVQLLTILAFFHFFSDKVVHSVAGLILLTSRLINQPFDYAISLLIQALLSAGSEFFILFAGMMATATIVSLVSQVGFMIATKAIGFKGEKINPVNNLKQIFSVNSIMELLKSCLKIITLCLIFISLFSYFSTTLQSLSYCGISCAIPLFSTMTRSMWYALLIFYMVLGVVDYAFQTYNTTKQQRMSKEDIKQENKDIEGDPQVKRWQREVQHEIQSGSLAQNVKKSAVVIRNPTHIAICLGYHPVETPIPKVLEKGLDARAEYIIALALRESVPVVTNISLARQLFYNVKDGEIIPESLFEPVATLLRMILELDYDVQE